MRVQVCRAQTAVLIRRKLVVVCMRGADPSGADPGVRVEHAAHRDDVLSGALGSWRKNRTVRRRRHGANSAGTNRSERLARVTGGPAGYQTQPRLRLSVAAALDQRHGTLSAEARLFAVR